MKKIGLMIENYTDKIVRNRFVAGISGLIVISLISGEVMQFSREAPIYLVCVFWIAFTIFVLHYFFIVDRISVNEHKKIVGKLHATIDSLVEALEERSGQQGGQQKDLFSISNRKTDEIN